MLGSSFAALGIDEVQWGDGLHALFDSREGDHALVFDGVDDSATTDGPVVDTLGSFAVSAHVLLNAAQVDGSESFTALSQDGVTELRIPARLFGGLPGGA